MGTVIDFPVASSRRPSLTPDAARLGDMGTVLILPVVRIERAVDAVGDGSGPGEGAAPGGGRRRRVRS
mgnify:CR=1 FL=1